MFLITTYHLWHFYTLEAILIMAHDMDFACLMKVA